MIGIYAFVQLNNGFARTGDASKFSRDDDDAAILNHSAQLDREALRVVVGRARGGLSRILRRGLEWS